MTCELEIVRAGGTKWCRVNSERLRVNLIQRDKSSDDHSITSLVILENGRILDELSRLMVDASDYRVEGETLLSVARAPFPLNTRWLRDRIFDETDTPDVPEELE